MALFFNLNELSLTDPFMKALKAVNSLKLDEEVTKHRASLERASKLAVSLNDVKVQEFSIGQMKCEMVIPDFSHNTRTVILYGHGGGYTVGGLSYARILATKMARQTGLAVMTFDYRLAPEHPYPAALEDGMAAFDYLLHLGYGAKNIILAGDSAGGNLVLCMTHNLASEGRILPKALILFSPWTDMTAKLPSYQSQKDKDPILTYDYICDCRSAYLPGVEDFERPEYSPLMGDFRGFPPTLIQVGRYEILQDDSNRLCKKMKKADVKVKQTTFASGWHVFQQMPTGLAQEAMAQVGEFVRDVLYNEF